VSGIARPPDGGHHARDASQGFPQDSTLDPACSLKMVSAPLPFSFDKVFMKIVDEKKVERKKKMPRWLAGENFCCTVLEIRYNI